ncbi:MAG TPA: dihydrofolate reductase family protein [Rhizomicrobium sp.]|jgi:dihydrofolate reductase|nr:dihydrofolate reductase family protein [Rhizomicrobium sp.]
MRKLISLMHVSLDGFCAGQKGEMNWIALNDEIFADVETLVERSGGAVYGRTTYGMMHGYWPGALTRPDTSARELRHAQWVEKAPKHTFSRTLESSDWNNVHLHKDAEAVRALKQQPGGDLLIFGSPGLTHAFLAMDAIDEFWINLNPVLLGQGVRYLDDTVKTKLTLAGSRVFDNGVIRLNYVKGN